MKLALKVDVVTLRGAREGVPALVDVLERHGAGATFFFSLGPDHTARRLRQRARSIADLRHESPSPSLFYGRLWPAPEVGRRARAVLRSVVEAGFETGILSYDAARWQRDAANANAAWTAAELQRAVDRHVDVFGAMPRAHASCGWQTNRHALRLTQRLAFDYASDGRGVVPHLPVWNGELVRCPQLPTTLPTLDELARTDGAESGTLVGTLLARTAEARWDHVFTLRAEVEGMHFAAAFESLLLGWKAQGFVLVPLRALFEAAEPLSLPRCEVALERIAGRSAPVLVQRGEFLADVELPRAA